MRLLLLTGKGGVGTTTVAAATAVHAAACGLRVLLLSADAPALTRVLGVDAATGADRAQEVVPRLLVRQVDAAARARRAWPVLERHLLGALGLLAAPSLAAEELTALPGADDVLLLLEVRDALGAATSHPWDVAVLDLGPFATALRLLALPEALTGYVDRVLPLEHRVERALAAGARAGGAGAPRDRVVEAAERLGAELAAVREVLSAAGTSVRLVVAPQAGAVADARDALTALRLQGHVVDGVVANRVVPGNGDDPWRSERAQAQAACLAEADASFAPVPVRRLGEAALEPQGTVALGVLGAALAGPPGPAAAQELTRVPQRTATPRVERGDGDFVLVVDLPLARRPEVDLARRGDDLLLTVGSHRRVIPLPGALRRCTVGAARFRDGALRVHFVPDPDRWRPL